MKNITTPLNVLFSQWYVIAFKYQKIKLHSTLGKRGSIVTSTKINIWHPLFTWKHENVFSNVFSAIYILGKWGSIVTSIEIQFDLLYCLKTRKCFFSILGLFICECSWLPQLGNPLMKSTSSKKWFKTMDCNKALKKLSPWLHLTGRQESKALT